MLANSGDPDQTPRSDLGLHCLPMSKKWDARLIWASAGRIVSPVRISRRKRIDCLIHKLDPFEIIIKKMFHFFFYQFYRFDDDVINGPQK